MRLSDFIRHHPDDIEREWETFARGLTEFSQGLDVPTLRNHLREILPAIADDMETPQSAQQQSNKSQGRRLEVALDRVTTIHARMRLDSGFSLRHVVAEYRALRASILRLFGAQPDAALDLLELTRFNETIDQSVAGVLDRFDELGVADSNRLIGVLVHDISGPLTTIGLATKLLDAQGVDPTNLARISRSVQLARHLVDDLAVLMRSRLAAGLPINRTECDLGLICEQVIEEFRAAYADKLFTFSKAGDLSGQWDREQLARVVSNLLGNATAYGRGPDIRIEAHAEAAEAILRVTNQGDPIPPERLGSIFEPLVRADSKPASSAFKGLGLGLYIVREIVRAHGGDVGVESSHNRGTIFTVRLPRSRIPAAAPSEPSAA